MRQICVFLLIALFQSGFSQINPYLLKIDSLQSSGDHFYQDGIFPSKRFSTKKKFQEDNNVFFTALTIYTLKSVYPRLNHEEQEIADTIIQRARKAFPYYSHRKDDITYNFWQTKPYELPYPNARLLKNKEKIKLPDDMDDTSLIYLALDASDSVLTLLIQKMKEQALRGHKVKSTLRKYRSFKAYPTWFANKMKQDFDICVMSNVLLLKFEKGLPLNDIDSSTIDFMETVLSNNDHIKKPHLVSPHYKNSAIILYHLSRTFSKTGANHFQSIKRKLILDVKNKIESTQIPMEKLILSTSLCWLEGECSVENLKDNNFENFYWFTADFFSNKAIFVKRAFARTGLLCLRYTCLSYYYMLLLENSVSINYSI